MSKTKQSLPINKVERDIKSLSKEIFKRNCKSLSFGDPDAPIRYEVRERHDAHMQMRRLLVYLRGNLCEWSEKAGGCTYCGFYKAKTKKHITGKNLLNQLDKAYEKYIVEKADSVALFNDGNYLNPREIDFKTQMAMLKKVRDWPELKQVLIESRPEFFNYYQLKQFKQIVAPKILEINVGIDSIDPRVVRLATNKGAKLEFTLKKIKMAQGLGIRICSSIIYKLPFLTEKEAFDNAYKTITKLLRYKINPEIEATTIQEGTFIHMMYQYGLYRPPWLWSLVELLRKLPDTRNVYLSPFGFAVDFIDSPRNCKKCTPWVAKTLFGKYERTRDKKDLPVLSSCCGDEWQKEMGFVPAKSLIERAAEAVSVIKERMNMNLGSSKN